MRVSVKTPCRMGNANAVQQVHGLLARFAARHPPVPSQRLSHLVADGVNRVQGCHGLLKNHANAVATQVA